MAEIGLISWRAVQTQKRPPLPSEILSTFIIFGMFSLIPNQRIGGALSWGIVVATMLNVIPTLKPPTATSSADPIFGGQRSVSV